MAVIKPILACIRLTLDIGSKITKLFKYGLLLLHGDNITQDRQRISGERLRQTELCIFLWLKVYR